MSEMTGRERAAVVLATGLGLGYSPVAPGTVGTLLGVAIVILAHPHLGWPGQVLLSIVLTACAFPVCDVAERVLGKKDDRRIVADEYLTFPICVLALPVSWEAWWILPMAFVTNRVCDILKPPPAYQFQRFKGGVGIVMDDVMAAVYSLVLNHALHFCACRWIIAAGPGV